MCIVAFAAASLFSSRISGTMGAQVLLSGSNCSVRDFPRDVAPDTDIYQTYFVRQQRQRAVSIENAANYALQCYSDNGARQLDCGTFITKRLPIKQNMTAPCPFAPEVCKSPDKNLILDTGYLSSHEHFGINAPPRDRFAYRKLMHCAPMITAGHTRSFNTSNITSWTNYNYGAHRGVSSSNLTYQYSNDARDDDIRGLDYNIG